VIVMLVLSVRVSQNCEEVLTMMIEKITESEIRIQLTVYSDSSVHVKPQKTSCCKYRLH